MSGYCLSHRTSRCQVLRSLLGWSRLFHHPKRTINNQLALSKKILLMMIAIKIKVIQINRIIRRKKMWVKVDNRSSKVTKIKMIQIKILAVIKTMSRIIRTVEMMKKFREINRMKKKILMTVILKKRKNQIRIQMHPQMMI